MNVMRLLRILVRGVAIWLIPAVLGAALAYRFTRNLPLSYSSSTMLSVGIFEPTSFLQDKDTRPPDYFRTGAYVDLLQTKVKQKDTLTRAALDLLIAELEREAQELDGVTTAVLRIPHVQEERSFPFTLQGYLRSRGPVSFNSAGLRELAGVARKWDPNRAVVANDPTTLADDLQAMLDDPRFPISVAEITKRLTTKREGVADIVKVEMTGSDPELVYRFLDRLIANLIRETEQDRRETSRESVKFISGKMEEAQRKLADAEEALRTFQQKHGISNYYEQAKYLADQRQKMYLVREEQRSNAEGLQQSIAELERLLGGDPRKVDLAANDQKLQEELLVKRMELARQQAEFDLNANLGSMPAGQREEESAKLKRNREELEGRMQSFWDKQFISLGAQRKDLLVQYYDLLVKHGTALRLAQVADEQLTHFQREMDQFAPLGADLKRLEREADLRSGVYLDLQREANRAQTAYEAAIQTSAIRVEQRPTYPMRPAPSKRKAIVAGAAAVPALAGIVLLVGLAFFDPSLRTLKLAGTQLGVAVGGGVPRLATWAVKRIEAGRVPLVASFAAVRVLANLRATPGLREVVLVPLHAAGQTQRVNALFDAVWNASAGAEAPKLRVEADLAEDPLALSRLGDASHVLLLWPMSRRPSTADEALLEDLRKAAADRVLRTVIVGLDSDATEEFLGRRPPLFARWRQ